MLLIGSFFFLFVGFIINSISQKRLLVKSKFLINNHHALAMVGLNVFGKYIPGKVWMVMGKAVYLSENLNFPVASLSLLFLNAQIIGLWCGLILGILGLFLNNALHLLSWAGLIILIFFTVIMFSKTAHDTILNKVNKLLRKNLNLPLLSIHDTISLIPWFFGGWIFWGVGFFLLASSISNNSLPFSTIFCFPLAGTLGILFIFAPGGIGIREGIMIGYLSTLNITLPEAITISAASRLWFIIGEIFIFATGYIAHRRQSFSPVIHNKVNSE
ncbi:MAG: flippase-like domain-containing protein [Deltaproteobacteria bacterium]|nr:flippase-like domain-containing protein [Deltaproteobacteria bacterium]